MAGTAITYNSFSLNDSNYITNRIEDGGAPERNLYIKQLVRRRGVVIGDSVYGGKIIVVSGKIVGSSTSNLETLIDALLQQSNVQDKPLDIAYAGSTRRWEECTAKNVRIGRPVWGANWAEFTIEFIANDYGIETSSTSLYSASSITASPTTKSLTIAGTAPEQFMRVEITLSAHTSSNYVNTISIENDTTGTTLSVQRNWTNGEVLEVDPTNDTVTIDGVAVDYSGAMPIFSPGTHNLIISDTFSTRTLALDVDYFKRYL